MNTSLSVPPKITNSVQPPLKKAELIRALAIRKREQLLKEREETTKLYNQERAAIGAELQAAANTVDRSGLTLAIRDPYVREANGKKTVEAPEAILTFAVPLTAELKKRIIANDERRHIVRFEDVPALSCIEAQLRAELSGQPSDRVGAILKDESAVKALDTLLAKIDRRAESRQLATTSINV